METKFVLEHTEEVYSTLFLDVPRAFLQTLKDAELLPHCVPELFPETFCGEIIIDPFDPGNKDECYSVDFYTDIEATKEMKDKLKKYHNRDITIDEDDETVNFSIRIYKGSGYIEKETDDIIILSF